MCPWIYAWIYPCISMDMSECLLRGVDLWTSSGCLLRRVDLDFPVGVNRGGYYYDVQSTRLDMAWTSFPSSGALLYYSRRPIPAYICRGNVSIIGPNRAGQVRRISGYSSTTSRSHHISRGCPTPLRPWFLRILWPRPMSPNLSNSL